MSLAVENGKNEETGFPKNRAGGWRGHQGLSVELTAGEGSLGTKRKASLLQRPESTGPPGPRKAACLDDHSSLKGQLTYSYQNPGLKLIVRVWAQPRHLCIKTAQKTGTDTENFNIKVTI